LNFSWEGSYAKQAFVLGALFFLAVSLSWAGKEEHTENNIITKSVIERQAHGTSQGKDTKVTVITPYLQIDAPSGTSALHKPLRGILSQNGPDVIYTPSPNAEGYDRFTYRVLSTTGESNYTVKVQIIPQPDKPRVYKSISSKNNNDWELISGDLELSFPEESRVGKEYIIIVDPDSYKYSSYASMTATDWSDSIAKNQPSNDAPNEFGASFVGETGGNLFKLELVDTFKLTEENDFHGWAKKYQVVFTQGSEDFLDYEKLKDQDELSFSTNLEVTDSYVGAENHNFTRSVNINVVDVDDPPKYTNVETPQTQIIDEFNIGDEPAKSTFSLSLHEEDNKSSFYFKVERKLAQTTDLDGSITSFPDLSSIKLINDNLEEYVVSFDGDLSVVESHFPFSDTVSFEENVTIEFVHDQPDLFGQVEYIFTPYEGFFYTDKDQRNFKKTVEGDFWSVTIDLENDNDDPLSLNLHSNQLPDGVVLEDGVVVIQHQEVVDERFAFDINPTDPDSHPSSILRIDNAKTRIGAKLIYSLEGADQNLFQTPEDDGKLYFLNMPDFEKKRDQNGDGKYEVVVVVDDGDGDSPERQQFRIEVLDKAEPPKLDDGNYSRIIHTNEDETWYSNVQGLRDGPTYTVDNIKYYALSISDPDGNNEISWIDPIITDKGGSAAYMTGDGEVPRIVYTPATNFAGVDTFTFLINETGTETEDGNSTTILEFTAYVEERKDPPFIEQVSWLNEELDGLGETLFEIPVPEDSESFEVDLLFNLLTDGNEFFTEAKPGSSNVSTQGTSTDFTLTKDANNPLLYKLSFNKNNLDYEDLSQRISTAKVTAYETNGTNEATQIFTFKLTIADVPERPIVFSPDWPSGKENIVFEEQDLVANLAGSDPDNPDSELLWKLPTDERNVPFIFKESGTKEYQGTTATLVFRNNPSFESNANLSYTPYVLVSDPSDKSDEFVTRVDERISFQLEDVAEPPVIAPAYSSEDPIQISIVEGDLTSETANLSLYFIDEDGDEIKFDKKAGLDSKSFIIEDGFIKFAKSLYSDSERFGEGDSPEYTLTILASDNNLPDPKPTEQEFKIILGSRDEPPEIKDLNDNIIFSSEKYGIQGKLTIEIDEDAEEQTYSFSDFDFEVRDPENTDGYTISVINAEQIRDDGAEFSLEPNIDANDAIFTFEPPENQFGVYPVDLNFTQKPASDGLSSFFTIEFIINDQPDPPNIIIQNLSEIEDDADSDNPLFGKILLVKEGEGKVLDLQANDSFDEEDSNQKFYWEIKKDSEGKPLYDGELFQDFDNLSSSSKSLFWDKLALNYKPTIASPDPARAFPKAIIDTPTTNEYKLVVTASESALEKENNNTEISTDIYLHVALINAETPPFFEAPNPESPNDFSFIIQENTKLDVNVTAKDYDNEEKPVDQQTEVKYVLGPGNDQTYFDINETTGKLGWVESFEPDFENPTDWGKVRYDNTYEVDIVAQEYFNDEIVDGTSRTQRYLIHLENTIETPYFLPTLPNEYDANFSVEEQTSAEFEISVSTDDADQNISLEIVSNSKDGRFFEFTKVEPRYGALGTVQFQFKIPPDFENPRDYNYDNIYEVDFKIKTNSEDADLVETFSVRVIDLVSKLEITRKDGISYDFNFKHPENQFFVTDLEVVDKEGQYYQSKEYPDLVLVSNKGTYYVSNSWSEENASSLFEGELLADNDDLTGNFISHEVNDAAATFAVFGDVDNNGSIDIITLSSNKIKVFTSDGLGGFQPVVGSELNDQIFNGSGLDHAILIDIDTDGDEDLIVAARLDDRIHIFENQSDSSKIAFRELGEGSGELTSVDGVSQPHFILPADINMDGNLDLVVANSGANQVVWFENLGSLNFAFGGVIAESNEEVEMVNPSTLEAIDLSSAENQGDPFACHDIIIGFEGGILLAQHTGKGTYQTKRIAKSSSTCRAIKAIDLDIDKKYIDIVYLTSQSPVPYYIRQKRFNDFEEPEPFFNYEKYQRNTARQFELTTASSLEVYTVEADPWDLNSQPIPYVFVSDNSRPYVWIFKATSDDTSPVVFEGPSIFYPSQTNDRFQNIYSLGIADLDRKSNFVRFKISGGFDEEHFDPEKIESGGKLFFKNATPDYLAPDYENAKGLSDEDRNTYTVKVTAFIGDDSNDPNTWIADEEIDVTVNVENLNDPPEINSILQGNSLIPSSEESIHIKHPENVLVVFNQINYSNQEDDQNVSFEIADDCPDGKKFEIDKKTGRLSFSSDHQIFSQSFQPTSEKYGLVNFLYLPDFESSNPFDLNGDNIFEVVVRAVDDGNASVEQSITIEITDVLTEFSDIEVTDFSKLFLSINEDTLGQINNLGSFVQSTDSLTFGIYEFVGLNYGHASISVSSGSHFVYEPDGNSSEDDQVFISLDNGSGGLFCLAVEVEVIEVEDPPVSLVKSPLVIPESDFSKFIVELKAVDGDVGDRLFWDLANPEDPHFEIHSSISGGENKTSLYFKKYANFEDPYSQSLGNKYTAELLLYDEAQNDPVKVFLEIRVSNVADQPPTSILKPLPGKNFFQVFEGENVVKSLEVMDPDLLEVPTVVIVGGDDGALGDGDLFVIEDGVLKVAPDAVLDYEQAKDFDGNNFYEFQIKISDWENPNIPAYEVVVEVLGVDEKAPYFLTGEGLASYEVTTQENQKYVSQLIAKDIDEPHPTNSLSFDVVGGIERDFFTIHPTSGLLEFREGQNFEFPSDSQPSGSYEVLVQVSDGVHETKQKLIVRLTDTNDIPYVSPSTFNLYEDELFNAVFQIIDEDGDPFSIELESDTSRGRLQFSPESFSYIPDTNVYGLDSFIVRLQDQFGSQLQTLNLNIIPVNDPPFAETDQVFYYNKDEPLPIVIDVLQNDHAGPDNSDEISGYIVELLTLPNNGSIVPGQNGKFEYTPYSLFLGEDSFEYKLIDGKDVSSTATGLAKIWIGQTDNIPAATYLKNFGLFAQAGNSWIYHLEIGWVYVDKTSHLLDSSWMWRENLGWFWTGDKYFKWVYHQGLQQWLHWEGSVNDTGGWFLRTEQDVLYYEKDFIRMQVRDEVIEILPSLEDLSIYVHYSTFFSDSEKKLLLTELALRGNSPTLNEILQFDFSY